MTKKLVDYRTQNGIAILELNDPPANTYTFEMMRDLDEASSAVLDDPDMRELMLPAIRADYHLADSYRPSPSPVLGAPVVAYLGRDDPRVRVWQLRAWAEVTKAAFDLVVFPGDHFYLRSQEAALVGDVARRLGGDRLEGARLEGAQWRHAVRGRGVQ